MIFQSLAEYEPRLPFVMFAFILIGIMIGLYIYFGLNFIHKGKKSKIDAQKSYYRGLGFFIITVASSEAVYFSDFLSRVLYSKRIFNTIEEYSDVFGVNIDSMFDSDYFVLIFMLLAFGLVFLSAPLEKYLLGRKRKLLTTAAGLAVPLPLIARLIEVFAYDITGMEVVEGSTYYTVTSVIWFTNIGVLSISVLILFSLYLKLGLNAPQGSKLRTKSKMIVLGLMIWIFAILYTSTVLKELWDNGNDWLAIVAVRGFLWPLYYILPFLIPALLLFSLALISSGFNREY
jgi:hypothetical protein